MPPHLLRALGCALLASVVSTPARAQMPADDGAYGFGTTVTVGGEITAALSPADDDAWFNYTGYEQNAIRMARVRLFGEWHASGKVSVVGELRAESGAHVSAPALYVRWQPAVSLPLHIQAGRIPPLVGAFPRRAYGRDNAVIGLPLAYQYLTSLRADALPVSIDNVLAMRGRGWLASYPLGSYDSGPGVPLVAVDEWDTGVEATWQTSLLDVSAAVTLGSPAVPVVIDTNDGVMLSTHVTGRLPAGVTAGLSAGRGRWIEDDVLALTPQGASSRSAQLVVGADVEWGRGPWLLRGEWLRSRFDVPLTWPNHEGARLHAWASFAEARYRPHPRWQLGARVDRLDFSQVVGTVPANRPTTWDAPVTRLEGIVGFRATRSLDIRAGWQHNWRDGGRVQKRGDPVVAVLYWF